MYLGSDEWGDWLGQPRGWKSARPGAEFTVDRANVTLVPAEAGSCDAEAAGLAPGSVDYSLTVNRDHPKGMRIYIDLGWDVRWSDDPLLITGIDMDLDVVRVDGPRGTWVDDRDEWAEHSDAYDYPDPVMSRLEALASRLEDRVRAQLPPFDDASADGWLDQVESLGLDR